MSSQKLKCQFHCHSSLDPVDRIAYSPYQAIDKAAELNYDVLSFTHHQQFIFDEKWRDYAKEKDILLIPGVEFEIQKKHILCINVDQEIEKVDSFKKLKEYRKSHPNCLIIAAHPYFPGKSTLKNLLEENIELFDAIENSFCYTKHIDYNKKAKEVAKKHNKTYLGTADCHILECLDIGYTEVEAEKNIKSIFEAIKKGKVKNHFTPQPYFKLSKIFSSMMLGSFLRKISKIGKKHN